MRDFVLMREIMAVANGHTRGDGTMAFFNLGDSAAVEAELKRLSSDGLLDADIKFDRFGTCVSCKVGGLTDEGAAFYRLVENYRRHARSGGNRRLLPAAERGLRGDREALRDELHPGHLAARDPALLKPSRLRAAFRFFAPRSQPPRNPKPAL